MKNKLSIVIVNYNSRKVLIDCLNSLNSALSGLEHEVIIVDNNSHESIEDLHGQYESYKFIYSKINSGYAAANNIGIKASNGNLILLLNPDTVVNSNSFHPMIKLLTSEDNIAVVGAMLINTDGRVENSTNAYPSLINEFFHANEYLKKFFSYDSFLIKFIQKHFKLNALSSFEDHHIQREVGHITGAYLMIKREVIDKVGLIDEAFFLYNEELEWCYRIKKAGYRIIYSPESSIIHHSGVSSEHKGRTLKYNWLLTERYRGKFYFFKKHYSALSLLFYRILILFSFSLKLVYNFFLYFFSKEKDFLKKKNQIIRSIIGLSFKSNYDWHADPDNVLKNGQK